MTDNKINLETMSFEWSQEAHCCCESSDFAMLKIRTCDGGGGPYVVINASEWSIDPLDGETPEDAIKRIFAVLSGAAQ